MVLSGFAGKAANGAHGAARSQSNTLRNKWRRAAMSSACCSSGPSSTPRRSKKHLPVVEAHEAAMRARVEVRDVGEPSPLYIICKYDGSGVLCNEQEQERGWTRV